MEIVDTATNRSLGLAVSEENLGGDITSMILVGANRGYAVVADENFANSVRPFELSSGTVGAPLENISGGFIASLAVDGDRLIVADRGSFTDPDAAGLKFYDAATELFCTALSTPACRRRTSWCWAIRPSPRLWKKPPPTACRRKSP